MFVHLDKSPGHAPDYRDGIRWRSVVRPRTVHPPRPLVIPLSGSQERTDPSEPSYWTHAHGQDRRRPVDERYA